MKNTIYKLTITVLAAAALALPLAAQAPTTYRADIPFEFTVGKTTMPAGQYTIQTSAATPVFLLQSSEAQCFFNSIAKTGYLLTPQSPAVVFNRYGDRYFLSAIKTRSSTREAPASKDEKELSSSVRSSENQILIALR